MKRLTIITLNEPGAEAALRLVNEIKKNNHLNFTAEVWKKSIKQGTDTDADSASLQTINTMHYQLSVSSEKDFHSEEYIKSLKTDSDNKICFNYYDSIDDLIDRKWDDTDIFLFFAATGIVIRKIAHRLESKFKDPAVIVSDFQMKYFIPLISGHVGGANQTAAELAGLIQDSRAVITTGTDQKDLPAFDVFADEMGFVLENPDKLYSLANGLLNGDKISLSAPSSLHETFKKFKGFSHPSLEWIDSENANNPTVIISPFPYIKILNKDSLYIRLCPFWLGCGMNRGTRKEDVDFAVNRFLNEHSLDARDVAGLASFDAKSDEEGLLQYASEKKIVLKFFGDEKINALSGSFSESMAGKYFGIKGVAEPCAVLASENGYLFLRKHVYGDVTLAAAF
jgi:cobalt-precorrin 5A hydrolase